MELCRSPARSKQRRVQWLALWEHTFANLVALGYQDKVVLLAEGVSCHSLSSQAGKLPDQELEVSMEIKAPGSTRCLLVEGRTFWNNVSSPCGALWWGTGFRI